MRANPGSLAAGGGAVWAASTLGGTIQRIDRDTGRVTQTVRLGADNVAAIAFGDGALWAADTTQRALVEIDPRTGSVGRTIKLDLRPTALVAGGGSIWVADQSTSSVEELDPATGSVTSESPDRQRTRRAGPGGGGRVGRQQRRLHGVEDRSAHGFGGRDAGCGERAVGDSRHRRIGVGREHLLRRDRPDRPAPGTR